MGDQYEQVIKQDAFVSPSIRRLRGRIYSGNFTTLYWSKKISPVVSKLCCDWIWNFAGMSAIIVAIILMIGCVAINIKIEPTKHPQEV